MDKVTCMTAFCEVVKEGGFSAAARKMNSSKVLVSRYISALEADLGVRLLNRTTRKMSTTDVGQAYFERCVTLLEDFQELDDAVKVHQREVTGKLKISVPSEAFTNKHLTPFFSQFIEEHPNIELDINLADRYIDIVDEGYDLAVRVGKLGDSSLIARKLADMRLLICASIDYLNQHKRILEPKDLVDHRLVVDSNYRGGQKWTFQKGGEQISIKAQGNLRVNSSAVATHILKQGLGVGLCPSFMVEEELKSGQLLEVLPDWEVSRGGIYALYSHRKHLSAKVKVILDALSEHFEETVSKI